MAPLQLCFYPALTGSKTPTLKLGYEAKQLGGRSTARKCPIGSTNNHLGLKDSPMIKVSLYLF
ncbi:hypothetical protein CON09_24915 [Bacillus anthracis]|nr:hypothetical protein CON09_24915 [Bacillus anthracis]PEY19364.1 hypothetical protein CN340_26285 [Bacillus anthracis]